MSSISQFAALPSSTFNAVESIVPIDLPTTGIQKILDQIQKAKMEAHSDQHPVRDIPDVLRAIIEERENAIQPLSFLWMGMQEETLPKN